MEMLKKYLNDGNYDADDIYLYVVDLTREQCIEFLQWNDRNGCYKDDQCRNSGLEPMTEAQAKAMVMKIMWEADHHLHPVSTRLVTVNDDLPISIAEFIRLNVEASMGEFDDADINRVLDMVVGQAIHYGMSDTVTRVV